MIWTALRLKITPTSCILHCLIDSLCHNKNNFSYDNFFPKF